MLNQPSALLENGVKKMKTKKPSVVHTSTSVLVKYGEEYFYISEDKKLFPIFEEFPWFLSELINELSVGFADAANKTAQNFHKLGSLDMSNLDVYIKALTAYSYSVNNNYTKYKIAKSLQ